jgi:hypothetical protein
LAPPSLKHTSDDFSFFGRRSDSPEISDKEPFADRTLQAKEESGASRKQTAPDKTPSEG